MSLADRPRPALLQVRSHPQGPAVHLRLAAARGADAPRARMAIAMLLENEVGREITSWSVELGDGDLALIRYTQYIDEDAPVARRRRARRGGRRDGARLVAGGRGRADRRGRRAARDPACADLHQQLPRRLSRAHRARGRRRRHPAPVRPRRRGRPRGPAVAARHRRARPVPAQDLPPRRRSSRCPTWFRCSRISASACSRSSRPRSAAATAISTISGSRSPPAPTSEAICERVGDIEDAIARVLRGTAEDDEFNQLVLYAELDMQPVVWLRAWFRYLRQTGSSFGLVTVVDALRRAPNATRALIGLFVAAHDPAHEEPRGAGRRFCASSSTAASPRSARSTTTASCAACARWSKRWCAPTPSRPRPRKRSRSRSTAAWFRGFRRRCRGARSGSIRPRVEGIHLRGGPVARGGLRWSDRRDDFRTEILGLMKAQLVKNAVIVPTGAKGGFYPKQLPPMSNRDAWLAEGTESYRIFIRSLLSVTDNLVNDKVVHPEERRDPRRRRSLFRGRRRQGHRDLLRHRQRDRADAQFLARRRLRQRRLERLRPQGDGDHRQGRVDLGPAPLPRNGHRRSKRRDQRRRLRRHVGRRVRQRHAAVEVAEADRRLRPPPHLHRSRSRSGEELGRAQAHVRACRDRAGTITTRS